MFPISRRQAERLFHFYAKAACIRGRYLYALRHTAATKIYRVTRNIKIVQTILGHENADTSALYAHIPKSVMEQLTGQMTVHV